MITGDQEVFSAEMLQRSRWEALRAIAIFTANLIKTTDSHNLTMILNWWTKTLSDWMSSNNSMSMRWAGEFILQWARYIHQKQPSLAHLIISPNGPSNKDAYIIWMKQFHKFLVRTLYNESLSMRFFETDRYLMQARGDAVSLLTTYTQEGIDPNILASVKTVEDGFTVADATVILRDWHPQLRDSHIKSIHEQRLAGLSGKGYKEETKKQSQLLNDIQARASTLEESINRVVNEQSILENAIQGAFAGALVSLGTFLPQFHQLAEQNNGLKMNPVVRSLVNALKTEKYEWFQHHHGENIAHLIRVLLSADDESSQKVAKKLAKNLCTFVCALPSEVFPMSDAQNRAEHETVLKLPSSIDAARQDYSTEPFTKTGQQDDPSLVLVRRGGTSGIRFLSELFEKDLFDKIPEIHDFVIRGIHEPLKAGRISENEAALDAAAVWNNLRNDYEAMCQDLINSLHFLTVALAYFPLDLIEKWFCVGNNNVISALAFWCQCPLVVVRHKASACLATFCSVMNITKGESCAHSYPMEIFIRNVLPLLSDTTNVFNRLGSAETLYHLLQLLGVRVVPYLVFFIVPVLGRMSDPVESVRIVVTKCFASMLQLMPLEVRYIMLDLDTFLFFRIPLRTPMVYLMISLVNESKNASSLPNFWILASLNLLNCPSPSRQICASIRKMVSVGYIS